MITVQLRVLLIAGSLITMIFMLYRIRAAKVQIKDTIFWIFVSFLLLLLSLFPGAAIWASRILGIISPMNFVLLLVVFLLLVHLFTQNMRISQMDAQIQKLSQRIAIDEKRRGEH